MYVNVRYNNGSNIKVWLYSHRRKNFQLWQSLKQLKLQDLTRLPTLTDRILQIFFSWGNRPAFNGFYKLPVRLAENVCVLFVTFLTFHS